MEKVHRHLAKLARRQNVRCFRLYDHDLPEFPFCIEIYEQNVYVAEYKRRHGLTDIEHEGWLAASVSVISDVLRVEENNIYLKFRQRKAGRHGQYQKTGETRSEFIVEENGLKFFVNLKDYLDTGLFLDHRNTRERLRGESKSKCVLNLFAYTGSFSVYAAAGGAVEVITVDLSKTYLDWAMRNMALNEFKSEARFKFIQADVMDRLGSFSENYFDLIVLDPPTFSNSKRMDVTLDIQRDHVKLINDCLRVLKAGGKIYFSTNYQKFQIDKNAIHSHTIIDITRQTTPFDFEGRLNRLCFEILKTE